jgi:2-phosphoglycerate kinase
MARKIILKEELSKSDIEKIVRDEVEKQLKRELAKMVENELKDILKNNSTKNDIADISKDILKKMYKDLSLHHTYVIDRIRL